MTDFITQNSYGCSNTFEIIALNKSVENTKEIDYEKTLLIPINEDNFQDSSN
jgi:hypothetical protein